MKKRFALWILVPALGLGSAAIGQGRLMDMAAEKVIARYQNASCEQLAMQRAAPKTPEQQRVVQFLRNDPTARAAFIDRIAAPIANKLFECGLIP